MARSRVRVQHRDLAPLGGGGKSLSGGRAVAKGTSGSQNPAGLNAVLCIPLLAGKVTL